MPYLELLWIPAVLGWIPLIYAGELSALIARSHHRDGEAADPLQDAVASGHADDPIR